MRSAPSVILAVSAVVCGTTISCARADEIVGAYERRAYAAGDTSVRYFVVQFDGEFTRANMERAARRGMDFVTQKTLSHIADWVGNRPMNFERHLVVGLVASDGTAHWTGVRIVGNANSEYRVRGMNGGYSDGWVVQDIRLRNGRVVRYQFADDDRGGLAWVMKHFTRD